MVLLVLSSLQLASVYHLIVFPVAVLKPSKVGPTTRTYIVATVMKQNADIHSRY